MSNTNRTTEHEKIRQWVEARQGWPAHVKGTGKGDSDAGLLRIDFPGYSGEGSLERIEWDSFFQKFDEQELEFLYQDATKDGDTSYFNKLVRREQS